MTTSLVRFSLLATLAVLSAACGGGGVTILNNAMNNGAGVSSIEIDPGNPSIAKGTSTQLSATALYSDNSHADVSMDLTWSSSDASVATVSSSGKITAVGTGTATITGICAVASVCGSASTTITVTVTPATLQSVAITPAAPRIAPGTTEQFTATGTFSDNSTQNLSADLTWTSSNPAVATVSSTGLVSSVGSGSATIRATCKVASVCGTLGGTITVTVTSATLVSIAIIPHAPSIAPGTSEQFTATGTFSDNSTQNLSADLTWTSSNPAAVTVSSTGLVTTIGTGSATVTATCRDASVCGTLAGSTTITVTAATLVSISITPMAPNVAVGTDVPFTATGHYSDNSTQDLTTQVTWISATQATATISNSAGSAGVAHSVASGTTQITATLGSVPSNSVTLTVNGATLVSIAVTPTGPGIEVSGSEQFVATGTYSDSSSQVITTSVTWASSDTSVATISNANNSHGLATGLLPGMSSISATLGSIPSPLITLTVTARTESVFWSFGGAGDGKYPPAGLILGTDGNFYGTTGQGGANNAGAVIKITPGGTESVLYSFTGGNDGLEPAAGLIQANDGNLYGTTDAGGGPGYGVVFQVTLLGVETPIYAFAGGTGDGANPMAGLLQATDGKLYGTTSTGGAFAQGTIFMVTLAGAETLLYSFNGAGANDGGSPYAGLTQGVDGNLYGTTLHGGGDDSGTAFELALGVETVLWSFGGTASDGVSPSGALVQGADGSFYGTTRGGGQGGTVFKVTTGGVETVLYSFGGPANDGTVPFAGLFLDADGNFYGTTFSGGANLDGTLFKITPTGTETVLYSFAGGSDGKSPLGGVIRGSDGSLYGTTELGGTYNAGTIFRY